MRLEPVTRCDPVQLKIDSNDIALDGDGLGFAWKGYAAQLDQTSALNVLWWQEDEGSTAPEEQAAYTCLAARGQIQRHFAGLSNHERVAFLRLTGARLADPD